MPVMAAQVVDKDLMQLMDDRNKSLASNLALRKGADAREDAAGLAAIFVDVEAYYVKKGHSDDAVGWARQSRALAEKIVKDVVAREFDRAAVSAVVLSKTCKSCHDVYRQDN